ncbi:hypothetical protein CPB86DRAFT_553637 [Serendipita vermifera]|nr:hypothetical protein CPB86DRAFT_553637 [Serendipita vermifera]
MISATRFEISRSLEKRYAVRQLVSLTVALPPPECARMSVQLTMLVIAKGRAVFKWPGNQQLSRGSLVNPGGPVGSVTLFVGEKDDKLTEECGREWYLISWDPRAFSYPNQRYPFNPGSLLILVQSPTYAP